MKGKIYGQLADDNGKPIFGIKIKASVDYSSIFAKEYPLGDALTDNEGNFEINYILDPKFVENKKNQIKLEAEVEGEVILTSYKYIAETNIDFGVLTINKVNIGVEGRVVDEKGDPIEGLTAIAEDVDLGKMELNVLGLIESKVKSFIKDEETLISSMDFIKDKYKNLLPFQDDYLGTAVTDKNGYYRIIYPPGRYREILEKEPDVRIIVKDKLGVFELRQTKIHSDITSVVENIDEIIINRAEVEGWHVTLDSDSPSRLTSNNSFEILIDNKNALEKIVEVIEKAESYIYLTQFEFYPDFIPRFFSSLEYKSDDPLIYKLLEAQNRGADVKIIINENAIVPDNYDELYGYFKDSKVEVRRFPAKGPYAMHAKVLVADGNKAFIIGSPFSQSYWDTNKHDIEEPRRLNKNEGPLHDVSIYLEGPVINNLEEFFIELWNYLSEQHFEGYGKIIKDKPLNTANELEKISNKIKEHERYLNENTPPYDTSNKINQFESPLKAYNESLQVVRSITPDTISKKGETGVLEAYRKAITNAEDFIYLENQYFTNKYIIGALKRVIELKPDLQLIMVINEVPDVPTYRSWQHYGFEFMGLDLQKLIIEHPQIGVFAKWSGKFQNRKNKLRNCYIHSKVAIVDDVWATIGTSNLDGSSLSCAEEFGSSESSENHRNMEMNTLIFDLDNKKTGTIKKFRKTLWSEHLGIASNMKRPVNGWLDLWKDIGYKNISKLEKEEIILHGGILPYSTKKNSKEQIKDLIEQYRRIKGRFNR